MSGEPLPEDLRSLLAAERERPALDASRVAALFDAMAPSLALPDAPHRGPAGGDPPADPPAPPAAPEGAQPPASDAGSAWRLLQKYPVGTLVSALLVGAAGGSAITHAVDGAPTTMLAPETVATAARPSTSAGPTVVALATASPQPTALPAREVPSAAPIPSTLVSASSRPEATGSRDTDLAVERTLIERARTALVRGNQEDALAATREHAQRFPSGRFAEERDFIAIRALVAAGDKAHARAAGDAFRKRYPRSLMLPALDEVLP